MSRQINNDAARRKLKELLADKDKALDAFEKEALEGFGMLGSDNEALDLKAGLDGRAEQLFAEQRLKSTRMIYWLAAAGFLLLVGLSVLFISTSTVGGKDLAITDTKTSQPPVQGYSGPDSAEQLAVDKPAAQQAAPEAKKTGRPKAEITHLSSGEKNAVSEEAPDASVNETLANASAESAPVKHVEATKALEDDAETKKEKEAETLAIEARKREQLAAKKAPELRHSAKNSKGFSQFPAEAKPAVSGAADLEKAPKADERNNANVYYSDGIETLKKTLKDKLIAKKCSGNFDATLFINKNGQVDKAQIDNPFGLSKKRQKQVIEILESLQGFSFYSTPTVISEFKLNYRE